MTPDKRATLYLASAHMGAIATAMLIPAILLRWPNFVRGLATGILLVSVILLLRRRLRDEYIESLWQAGTTLSFIAIIAWFILAPFAEGMIDGLFAAPNHQDFPVSGLGLASVAAFFIGFHWRWLRSRL